MIAFTANSKWRALVLFLFQNSLLIIGLRACAIYSSATHVNHIASSVVVVTEFSKLMFSLGICFIFEAQGSVATFKHVLFKGFVDEAADCLKLMVPAVLYAIQNNLQYVIESAPLFLVVYQMKIITTAVFYSILLSRRLSLKEWGCIFALSVGVSMVESSQNDILPHHASDIMGVVSVIAACVTSGFAGVYFEKITKSSKSSIWVLNVQMSLLSCFMCMIMCLVEDTEEIIKHGFFKGFNQFVYLIIILQASTGLIVALVVKYADNVHKSFAASASILISHTLDYFLFQDTTINETFLFGALLVTMACSVFFTLSANSPLLTTSVNINSNNSSSTGATTIGSGLATDGNSTFGALGTTLGSSVANISSAALPILGNKTNTV